MRSFQAPVGFRIALAVWLANARKTSGLVRDCWCRHCISYYCTLFVGLCVPANGGSPSFILLLLVLLLVRIITMIAIMLSRPVSLFFSRLKQARTSRIEIRGLRKEPLSCTISKLFTWQLRLFLFAVPVERRRCSLARSLVRVLRLEGEGEYVVTAMVTSQCRCSLLVRHLLAHLRAGVLICPLFQITLLCSQFLNKA